MAHPLNRAVFDEDTGKVEEAMEYCSRESHQYTGS